MPVIRNQIGGHVATLDFANVSYTAANIAATTTSTRQGTITVALTGTAVTGVNTNFVELNNGNLSADGPLVGAQLFTSGDVLIGTVASVQSNTALTLAAGAAVAVTSGAFKSTNEVLKAMGVSKIMWVGDWVVRQGANVLFQTTSGTSGLMDFYSQGIVLQGSNTVANITANSAATTGTISLILTKYARNTLGVG